MLPAPGSTFPRPFPGPLPQRRPPTPPAHSHCFMVFVFPFGSGWGVRVGGGVGVMPYLFLGSQPFFLNLFARLSHAVEGSRSRLISINGQDPILGKYATIYLSVLFLSGCLGCFQFVVIRI